MPSWQSKVLNPIIRLAIKRRLLRATTALHVRRAFGSKFPGPSGAKYTPGTIGGIAGEFVTAGGVPAGTMLYLHGGGYVACSPKTHRSITGGYAVRGLKLFVPDYRLAPEHPFPAALDDALAAYKGLLDSGIAPDTIAIGGDSAGGGLTLATLLAAKAAGLPLPGCAMVFSPWTDLAITGNSAFSNIKSDVMLPGGDMMPAGAAFYLNGADAQNPLASPLYGDLAGLSPLYITVSRDEVLRDDSTRFAAAATAAGVAVTLKIVDGMPHVWPLFQIVLPEARATLDEAAAFAKSHLKTDN